MPQRREKAVCQKTSSRSKSPSALKLAPLPQLADKRGYRPCDWDLKLDPQGRAYWAVAFCRHLDTLLPLVAQEAPHIPPHRLEEFKAEYLEKMQFFHQKPERFARIDILALEELRRQLLVEYEFPDPYRQIKRRENERALRTLPALLREIDAKPREKQMELLARGLLAGNLFDLGSMPTIERYRKGQTDFWVARNALPRPWRIDDLDRWRKRWGRKRSPYEHIFFFVDNAGPDIVLGALPLVRWMLHAGGRVTLAANTTPALNDVTAEELGDLLPRAAALDRTLAQARADGRLTVAASGNGAPLIDLKNLSAECAKRAADADLIILLGMGRGVESNYRAKFTCDVLRIAVVKDLEVAKNVGANLFDCLFRFEPVAAKKERAKTRSKKKVSRKDAKAQRRGKRK